MKEYDGTEADAMQDEFDEVIDTRAEDHDQLIAQYNMNKNAQVGSAIYCPVCHLMQKKTTYHKIFCSTKTPGRSSCKDIYWNTVNPRGLGLAE